MKILFTYLILAGALLGTGNQANLQLLINWVCPVNALIQNTYQYKTPPIIRLVLSSIKYHTSINYPHLLLMAMSNFLSSSSIF